MILKIENRKFNSLFIEYVYIEDNIGVFTQSPIFISSRLQSNLILVTILIRKQS